MTQLVFDARPHRIDAVLHPTDLSEASERAFHHALAIAMRRGAAFTLLHAVGRRETDNWADFPSVSAKLAQWREAGTATDGASSRVTKVEVPVPDPVEASMEYIGRHDVDLLVLATEGRRGLARLIRPSRAETLARRSKIDTLFVPHEARPFVDGDTGRVSLRRILVPIDPGTDPRPAMLRAVQSAALLEDPSLEITLLHVSDGAGGEPQSLDLPDLPYCTWHAVRREGDPVKEILKQADELEADAIYMSSHWSERAKGSDVTERVIEGSPCPVTVAVV